MCLRGRTRVVRARQYGLYACAVLLSRVLVVGAERTRKKRQTAGGETTPNPRTATDGRGGQEEKNDEQNTHGRQSLEKKRVLHTRRQTVSRYRRTTKALCARRRRRAREVCRGHAIHQTRGPSSRGIPDGTCSFDQIDEHIDRMSRNAFQFYR